MPTPRRLAVLSVLALLAVAPLARAQSDKPDLPDSPAGRAAAAWFEAVRSNDADKIRNLIENRFDADFRDRVGVEQHLNMHTALASAGLNAPHSVARATDHAITLYLRDGGVWGELQITVNPEPPHGITNVGVRPSQGPPEARGRPATALEFRDETFEFLRALHDAGSFDGAVYVTGHGVRWTAPDARRELPIDFALEAIMLAVPLSVSHKSWSNRIPQPLDGVTLASDDGLRDIMDEILLLQDEAPESEIQAVRERPIRKLHARFESLTDSIFAGDSPPERAFQRGLVNALVFEPLSMTDCEVPFAAEPRMNPADLARFGHGILDPEYIPEPLLVAATTGIGPDLDPSPDVVRRTALAGFEERVDDNAVRSFSLIGEAGDDLVLLRCYPSVPTAVVIIAPDKRTLNLIDRRIFNRLPGLDTTNEDG